jgi:hypothetical protein
MKVNLLVAFSLCLPWHFRVFIDSALEGSNFAVQLGKERLDYFIISFWLQAADEDL